MSLVFEALRRYDDTTSPQQSKGSVLTAGRSLRRNRLWSILLWVLAGVLLGASYALLQPYASDFMLTTKPQLAQASLHPLPEPLQQGAVLAAATTAQAPATLEPVQIPEAPAVTTVMLPDAAAIVKKPTVQPAPKVEKVAASVAAATPEPNPVISNPSSAERVEQRQLLQRFNTAMAGGHPEQAAKLLEQARNTLGPKHLMVLRMSGYYCLQQNCNEQAQHAYQAILALLPSDKEAGYNLAVLEGRNGQLSQALGRVNQLLQNHPDDQALRALQQTLHQERR